MLKCLYDTKSLLSYIKKIGLSKSLSTLFILLYSISTLSVAPSKEAPQEEESLSPETLSYIQETIEDEVNTIRTDIQQDISPEDVLLFWQHESDGPSPENKGDASASSSTPLAFPTYAIPEPQKTEDLLFYGLDGIIYLPVIYHKSILATPIATLFRPEFLEPAPPILYRNTQEECTKGANHQQLLGLEKIVNPRTLENDITRKLTFIIGSTNSLLIRDESLRCPWSNLYAFTLSEQAENYYSASARSALTEDKIIHQLNTLQQTLQDASQKRKKHHLTPHEKQLLKSQPFDAIRSHFYRKHIGDSILKLLEEHSHFYNLNHSLALDLTTTSEEGEVYHTFTTLTTLSCIIEISFIQWFDGKIALPIMKSMYTNLVDLTYFLWHMLPQVQTYPNAYLDTPAFPENPAISQRQGLTWRKALKRTLLNNLMDYCYICYELFPSYIHPLVQDVCVHLQEDPALQDLVHPHTKWLWFLTLRELMSQTSFASNKETLMPWLIQYSKDKTYHYYHIRYLETYSKEAETEEEALSYYSQIFDILTSVQHNQNTFFQHFNNEWIDVADDTRLWYDKSAIINYIKKIYDLLGKKIEKNKFLGITPKKRKKNRRNTSPYYDAGSSSTSFQTVNPFVSSSLTLKTNIEEASASKDTSNSAPSVSPLEPAFPQESETKHVKALAQHILNKQTDKKAKKDARKPTVASSSGAEHTSSSSEEDREDPSSEKRALEERIYQIEDPVHFDVLMKIFKRRAGKVFKKDLKNLVKALGGEFHPDKGKGSHGTLILGEHIKALEPLSIEDAIKSTEPDTEGSSSSGANVVLPKKSAKNIDFYLVRQIRQVLQNFFLHQGFNRLQFEEELLDIP